MLPGQGIWIVGEELEINRSLELTGEGLVGTVWSLIGNRQELVDLIRADLPATGSSCSDSNPAISRTPQRLC